MIWWVLTFLYIDRTLLTLFVRAHTNLPDHLWMKWAVHEPARSPIWRTVRGKQVFCGYKYIWDTPFLTEQREPGHTIERTFFLEYLLPTDHIWFYLCSPAERLGREIQGPLIHVPPQEQPLPTARIFHSIAQTIPSGAFTYLTFDSYLWDNYNFYDPGDPTKLTIPMNALFAFGASLRLETATAMRLSLAIRINASHDIAYHGHQVSAVAFGGGRISVHSIMAIHAGDFIQCRVYHNAGIPRDVLAVPEWSPHFWIADIGPYPISPVG